MNNSNTAVFSVCNIAYLSKAMVLAKSLYNNDSIVLNLFIFDKKQEVEVDQKFCNIIWIEDVGVPNFNHLAFKYNVIEFTTSLKPFLAIHLLKKHSRVVFFDPDIMILNSISPIIDKLNTEKFLLTPHFNDPAVKNTSKDINLMRFGFFNLGFFASDNSKESLDLLSWWNARCNEECFDDSQFGIFTDQKWLSIAPFYFPMIKVIYNKTYNVAYWNLFEREIKIHNGNYYINNIDDNSKLIFFHFSSLSKDKSSITFREFDKGDNSDNVLSSLTSLYKNELRKNNFNLNNYAYSYDFFDNGDFISQTLRRAYACSYSQLNLDISPFKRSDKMKNFVKINYLSQTKAVRYSNKSYSDMDSNKLSLKIYYSILKLILFVVGPTKFMDLSRLFYYSSSYHRLRNFWKV